MARTRFVNRSPEERLRIGRRICVGSQLFETAGFIALIFLLTWPTNLVVVCIGLPMLTAYNILLWRTIKREASKDAESGSYSLL